MQKQSTTPWRQFASFVTIAFLLSWTATTSHAVPSGYVLHTIPLDAPPVGLAFDADGVLYALEEVGFGNNVATLRSILPDGTFGDSWSVVGDDENNFFTGSMTYDHTTDSFLITDNTADGRLYSVDKQGMQTTLATSIPAISGVAVRSTGEIFVSTSLGAGIGGVYQVDRTTGSSTPVLDGLDFGGGLAFDPTGNLVVQDAAATAPYLGRLQQLPVTEESEGLSFGTPSLLLDDMQVSAGLLINPDGQIFTTGSGGLFTVTGTPLEEVPFYHNDNPGQFATAMAFDAGAAAFAPFAGVEGGRLALMADYGFPVQDLFITLITPAVPEDFNSDGVVDGVDLAIWENHFGTIAGADPTLGDANQDGVVDGFDFLHWQRAYSPTAAPGEITIIPEPSGAMLSTIVLSSLYVTRLARRRRVG